MKKKKTITNGKAQKTVTYVKFHVTKLGLNYRFGSLTNGI